MSPRRAALALVLVALAACRRREPLRVGTYNIRNFGAEPTDVERLAGVLLDARPAVLGVQEVVDPAAVERLEARVAARGGPRYRHALARCGGARGLLVGFLYDPSRAPLARTEEFPALDPGRGGECATGDRAGLVGVFGRGDGALHVLVMHLAAGSDPERVERRRAQWTRAFSIARRLREGGAARVVVLGDANSTGWLDDRRGERTFIESGARAEGLSIETAGLACTEFWRAPSGDFEPSVLDHVLASPAVGARGARVHGYCARLACRRHPGDQPTAEYATVSDHCPVTVEVP